MLKPRLFLHQLPILLRQFSHASPRRLQIFRRVVGSFFPSLVLLRQFPLLAYLRLERIDFFAHFIDPAIRHSQREPKFRRLFLFRPHL